MFILPVAEDLARQFSAPTNEYIARFYEYFSDDFDFLIFLANVGYLQLEPGTPHGAFYWGIKTDVQGIGQSIYNYGSSANTEKLQGVIYINTYDHEWGGDFANGVLLHELMHRWATFVVGMPGHWGFISENCILDGYDISIMVDHDGGVYSHAFPPSILTYCPIELYLAGFIPPQDVPDFRIAVDGEWLRDHSGNIIEDDNGYRMFTASGIETYSIDDIVAAHGARIPDSSQAQKDFRAAVVLLIGKDYPATAEILDRLSEDAAWFSYPANRQHRSGGVPYSFVNFYQATGGRGTITMDGLLRFRKNAP